MAQFVKHTSCPKCGSRDNLAVYDDGSYFCFSHCGYMSVSEELKTSFERNKSKSRVRSHVEKESLEHMEVKPSTKPAITEDQREEIRSETSVIAKGFRGITDEVSKYFGVRYAYSADNGEVIEQYYPVTQEGQLTGYKIREVPKNFRSIGRTGADCELFGQFRFNRGGKYVLVTEGECLLPSTKVLTRNGWVSLEDYEESHGEVMQGDGTFAKPLAKVHKQYNGKMLSYASGSYSLDMTPEHNMIRIEQSGNHIKVKAADKTQKHKAVPRVVSFQSKTDDLRARLQVMLSADFTFREEGDIYGCLKKQRKIERAKMLLDNAGIRYVVNTVQGGYSSFFIHRGHNLDVSKKFIYERDIGSAATIINELVHWDGNSVPNRNQIEYSTVIRENAEFIQTCSHLCGFTSSIIPRSRDKYNWFKVSILFGKQISTTLKGYQEYDYNGVVSCLTMPQGSLLVKQGDSISVTGNCDTLSAYQMLQDYNRSRGSDFETAVVSPTTGAQSKKQIAAQYKFFDTFDNIILCYDNDRAGQEAAEEIIKYLPKGKVKVMHMRYKDANEYLMQGKEDQFIRDFYSAEKPVPVGVLPSDQLYDRLMAQARTEKLPWPEFMGNLNDFFKGGIPLGHIVNIAAATSVGKTTVVNELLYYWVFNSPHKCGIVSMELDAGQYAEALLSRHLNRKLVLIADEEEKLAYLQRADIKAKSDELLKDEDGNPRFYLLDNRDGTVEEIQQTVEELVVSCGCKVIVIDVLQDIIAALPNEEQELFLKWSKSLIKSHGITLVYINHTRKTSAGQNAADDEQSIHGSSSIIKSASVNIMLKRDKMAEDPIVRNKTEILVHKNRIFGITGPAGAVYYDNETHTLHNFDKWLHENGVKEF